ncbi:MAG: dTDP-4-dehydrorhamnose reductase [Solirubrobacteraceae bacterium]|jgi:dTDP-4-dehydrorhamnose reductase|nr:dTDP-4-dehydrorhamnose reductase [Solirubrobacteraceae bacterium]
MPSTLFVTGLAGLLGGELARQALAAGCEVRGTVLQRPCDVDGVGAERVDVRDAGAVRDAIAAARPDAVVHTAYRQGGPDARATIVAGSAAVAAAARVVGARLVHLSTDVVFSGRLARPLTEDDAPDPLQDYGLAKAAAEQAVAAADPGAVIVRTSLIHGGREPGPQERLALEPFATFYTDELRCPVHVGDLAAAVLELAALDVAGPLHVAGADGVDRLAFARALAAAAGRDPAELRGAPGRPERPKDCRLDTTRARALLRTPLRGLDAVGPRLR